MTRNTFQHLISLDPESTSKELPPCFDDATRNAFSSRLTQLIEHAHALAASGRIVDDWEQWRDPVSQHTADEMMFCDGLDLLETIWKT